MWNAVSLLNTLNTEWQAIAAVV